MFKPSARRRTKYFISIVLIVVVLLVSAIYIYIYTSTYQSNDGMTPIGTTVIDADQWNEILSISTETSIERSAILFNGAQIAYDAAINTFYIPQDMETDLWSGKLSTLGSDQILILNDQYLYHKSDAIADGHSFTCLYQSGSEYSQFNLVFTGLPTVAIEYSSEEEIIEKEDHNGRIHVRETDGTYQVSECVFHVRGQLASKFDKKSWKISLTTASGDKNHLSFCGMRKDDDWILNALLPDATRIRESLAYWSWDTMQSMLGYSSTSPNTQFAEFFLNDEYCGLYLLMEPLDGKTLGLTDEDFLYQSNAANYLCQSNAYEIYDKEILTDYNGENQTDYGEIRWPKSEDGSGLTWDLLQYIYDYGDGSLTWNELLSRGVVPDIMNMALYEVFTVLTYAYDNLEFNMMLECTLQEDGTYSMRQIPWDLSFTFGSNWNGEMKIGSAFTVTFLTIEDDHNFLWDSFMSEFPEEAEECTRVVWRTLRDAGLNADLICDEGEALWQEVSESGAYIREKALWRGDYEIREDNISLMLEWIQDRFNTLDTFYGYNQN